MQVKDIMSTSVKTVTPATQLIEVVSLMCLYRYSGLPVVDNGKLVGSISEKDILNDMLPDVDELMGMLSLGDVHKAIYHKNISSNLSAT